MTAHGPTQTGNPLDKQCLRRRGDRGEGTARRGRVDLRRGDMVAVGEEPVAGGLDGGASEGTLLGKRYVDDGETMEVLCTKPGTGSLGVNGVSLQLKEAKPLPASD